MLKWDPAVIYLFVMPEFSDFSPPNNALNIYGEFQQSINARLDKKQQKFVVDDERHRDQLRDRGFGEKEDNDYVLKSYEALYLSYTKKLIIKGIIKGKDDIVGFDDLVRILIKRDKNI